jgi:N-acyl-D-amino-acid deacylase
MLAGTDMATICFRQPVVRRRPHPLLALTLSLIAFAGHEGQARQTGAAPTYDLIIRGGTVIDGTGAPRFIADVGVAGGTVRRIGDLRGQTASTEIDARGRYVTPGFINIHSHATIEGLRSAENMLAQGVTTELLNADGGGPVDLRAQQRELSGGPLAVNVAASMGFNAVWADVMGSTDRRPTADETRRMRARLEQGLIAGAFGISAGLDYKPAYYATAEEVTQIIDVARPWRTFFTNHDRLTPESGFSSKVGVAETLSVAARAGLMPVVTHMKAQGREQGTAPALLAMMQDTTARGTYTAADVYPYLAGQSGLAALIIPGWALEGGRDAMLTRFADPTQRRRIVAEAEEAMRARFGGPEGVYATGHQMELVDAMRTFGTMSAGEALLRLLEQRDGGAILRFGIESDLIAILRHPTASVACDCGAVTGRAAHPRYYGTYPRVLGRYVREQQVLTWEEAIRKMTGLPAATMGLVNRGGLAPGMMADIVVFDPATVIDHATFERPTAMPEGVTHVVVNGVVAWREGRLTGATAGRVLVRGRHEPSRPQSTDERVRVNGRARTEAIDVDLDLTFRPGDRQSRGTMQLTDRASGRIVSATEIGPVQVGDRWIGVTMATRASGSISGAATLVFESIDTDGTPSTKMTMTDAEGRVTEYTLPGNGIRISRTLR